MGISTAAAGMLATSAFAQSGTPASGTPEASPVAGTAFTSITRDEYLVALEAEFPFEAPETTGGQVIMVTTTDIATMNPVTRSDVIALYAINSVFSYLALQSAIDGSMVPDLADYWERAADGVTYTFHLNQDATWHDGQPVTAHDCVHTFDAVMAEETLSPVRSDFVQVIKSFQAIDDHTFELVSTAPIALALEKSVAAIPIMPKHIWEGIPFAEWGAAPGSTGSDPTQVIGSGPFKFVEWVTGDHVTIVRNDDYFVPAYVPTIDTWTLRVVADPQSAMQSLVTGEADIAYKISPQQLESLQQSNPDFQFAIFDDWSWTFILMNADTELGQFFADRDVRQAVMYSVDRDLIVETIVAGLAVRADGVQPPSSPAYAPDQVTTIYNYDPEQSRALLEAAGWVDSDGDGIREKDGVKFSTEFQYAESEPINQQLVPYLQQAWQEIGIEIIPKALPAPTLIELAVAGDYQLATMKITWTIDDMGVLYRCDAIPPGGFNLARHCNPEYDRLNDESLYELDPEKRRELIIEQGNVSNDDAHFGLLYFGKSIFPAQPRVRNFFANGILGVWSQARMWVADE